MLNLLQHLGNIIYFFHNYLTTFREAERDWLKVKSTSQSLLLSVIVVIPEYLLVKEHLN
jgi:hypothetical protein